MSGTGANTAALFAALSEAPAGFRRGLAAARAVGVAFPPDAVRNVAVCGVGAAADAGHLVMGACAERMLLPVSVHTGYSLPGWVGEDTLVILLSVSGASEETLTCASIATERNALCVAVTGGGKLGGFYADEGVPVVPVPADGPAGGSTPELIGVLLGLLDRWGVLALQPGETDEVADIIERAVAACRPDAPADANPARALATALDGVVPMVWGGELTAPVARRWVAQMRLHAKGPAFASELPQLDHDELMAFPGVPGDIAQRLRLVLLRDSRQQRQVQRRFEHTAALVGPLTAGSLEVTADGNGALARVLDLMILGDHLALYLAEARGVDAGPGNIAAALADRLATTGMGRTAQN